MSKKPPPQPPTTAGIARAPRGSRVAIIKGQDNSRWTDLYHGVLTASWQKFLLQLASLFIIINIFFALLYRADPGGVTNARPGSLIDAFFFSVQTLGTLGYGVTAPKSLYANLVVTAESFCSILIIALFTGMMFARFSRPFARVIFSRVAVITPFDGVPTLMFRAANQRGNSILDAGITVSLARQYTTREGIVMRGFEEMKLVRAKSPLFALSWTVMHRIDETSPLYGVDSGAMREREMELVAVLNGLDETLAARIYARHAYTPGDILWNRRFVDVISITSQGQRLVDLTHFHETHSD